MINIGINGFGRIGKTIFHQVINDKNIRICGINLPGFKIDKIQTYINYDSNHKTELLNITKIDNNKIKINNNIIQIFDNRVPDKNMWNDCNAKYVFETTGKFLTTELARQHNSEYFIMCAPSKDNTPQYLFNGNHHKYKGENIISNSSCTTNCIVPLLKLLNDNYGIIDSNFITIHAVTSSQNVLDSVHVNNRSHRSIFNNTIPHTTGASKSAIKILPTLNGRIFGTSVRVPTSNVSMVDLNVTLKVDVSIEYIFDLLRESKIVEVNDNEHLVSSDFMTTTNPTIVDAKASMTMGNNQYKFTIWYDNEWSYSAQAIKLLKYIHCENTNFII